MPINVTFMREKVLATATVAGTRGTGFPPPTEEMGPFEMGTVSEDVAVGVSSASNATVFAAGFPIIRVAATEAARFTIGTAPTATSTDSYIAAGGVEYFKVIAGDKLAAINP